MYVKHTFPAFGFYNMLVGACNLIVAGALLWIHPVSAPFPALAGGCYLYLGYHLRKAASRQLVVCTAIVYALQAFWFAYGPFAYQVRMSPGILIGIVPGSFNLSFDVVLQAVYDSAGGKAPVLGFDLLALFVLFYLVDQYIFVPKKPTEPPADILDV